MTEPDFESLRREFPVLARKTYLNSGSYCALANEVKAAFEAYMDDRLLVGANWDLWITKNEAVRSLTASLLRALPDEIAVTASVSAGLNALASALDFSGPRNKVVVSDFEFPDQCPDLARTGAARRPGGACAARRRTAIFRSRCSKRRSMRARSSSPSRMSASATVRSSTSRESCGSRMPRAPQCWSIATNRSAPWTLT